MKDKQRTIWKIFSFDIEGIGQIQQINEKLGQHIEGIKGIYVSIVPTNDVIDETHDVGELSLLFNNQKEHAVHISSEYNPELLSKTFEPFTLNQPLDINHRITGYYRDNGSLKNEFDEFINHKVKILLECTIKATS